MNHHLAKTYRRRRFYALGVAILVVIFFLFQKGFFKTLSPVFLHIVKPIWQAENFTADYLGKTFESKTELYKQNILLKKSIEEKNNDLLTLEAVKKENEDLKTILGRTKREYNVVLSAILAKPNVTPYDVLMIDAGTEKNIKEGDKVFASGTVLLGEVESVSAGTARVLMYSTPGNITQVVLDSSGKYFNARGLGGGTFEVDVPRELEVKEGENFFYPGIDDVLLGVAKKIEFESRDSFKKVIIQSPVNIQEERWVEVRI